MKTKNVTLGKLILDVVNDRFMDAAISEYSYFKDKISLQYNTDASGMGEERNFKGSYNKFCKELKLEVKFEYGALLIHNIDVLTAKEKKLGC